MSSSLITDHFSRQKLRSENWNKRVRSSQSSSPIKPILKNTKLSIKNNNKNENSTSSLSSSSPIKRQLKRKSLNKEKSKEKEKKPKKQRQIEKYLINLEESEKIDEINDNKIEEEINNYINIVRSIRRSMNRDLIEKNILRIIAESMKIELKEEEIKILIEKRKELARKENNENNNCLLKETTDNPFNSLMTIDNPFEESKENNKIMNNDIRNIGNCCSPPYEVECKENPYADIIQSQFIYPVNHPSTINPIALNNNNNKNNNCYQNPIQYEYNEESKSHELITPLSPPYSSLYPHRRSSAVFNGFPCVSSSPLPSPPPLLSSLPSFIPFSLPSSIVDHSLYYSLAYPSSLPSSFIPFSLPSEWFNNQTKKKNKNNNLHIDNNNNNNNVDESIPSFIPLSQSVYTRSVNKSSIIAISNRREAKRDDEEEEEWCNCISETEEQRKEREKEEEKNPKLKEKNQQKSFNCGENCLNRNLYIECTKKNCNILRFIENNNNNNKNENNDNNSFLVSLCSNQNFQRREKEINNNETKELIIPFKTLNNRGWGTKANKNIKEGEFLLEYVGEIINSEECEKRMKIINEKAEFNKKTANYYFLTVENDYIIDAQRKGNYSRFTNHSCEPNANIEKWKVGKLLRIGFFAKKNIKKGEEITIDYRYDKIENNQNKKNNKKKQKNNEEKEIKERQLCYCGAKNCNGLIGGKEEEKIKQKENNKNNNKINNSRSSNKLMFVASDREREWLMNGDSVCGICGDGGDLIGCDQFIGDTNRYCNRVYHIECLDENNQQFYLKQQKEEEEREKEGENNKSKTKKKSQWICQYHHCPCGKKSNNYCLTCSDSFCFHCKQIKQEKNEWNWKQINKNIVPWLINYPVSTKNTQYYLCENCLFEEPIAMKLNHRLIYNGLQIIKQEKIQEKMDWGEQEEEMNDEEEEEENNNQDENEEEEVDEQ